MSDTTEFRRRRFEITPPKVGLAMQVFGHYLMGAGAITSVSGTRTEFITIIVWAGFFIGGFGGFVSTLYTNGSSQATLLTWGSQPKTVDKPVGDGQTSRP